LSDNKNVAKLYGNKVLECFVSIKKPFVKDYKGANYWDLYGSSDLEVTAQYNRAKKGITNNDGVIFYQIKDALERNSSAELGNNYIPFDSKQIKLADGSNTTFDGSNPDIRFDGGGYVDLFEEYEQQPAEVRAIYDKYQDKIIDGDFDYSDSAEFLKEMQSIGYTFDYGLDNEPYGLRPKGVQLNQLRGYEEFENGGQVKTINDKLVYRGDDNRLTTIGTIRNVKGEKRVYKSPFAKVFIKENTDELVENWAKENGYAVWKEDFGNSYEGGGSAENENEVYIEFLNKEKNFTKDKKSFKTYEDAVKWARENFDKFNPDMIRYYSVGGSTKPNPTQKIKNNDLMNRTDYTAYVVINDFPYTATVRSLNSFKNHLNRKDEKFTPNVFGEITYISDNASDEWVYELNKLIDNKKKEMENKMENVIVNINMYWGEIDATVDDIRIQAPKSSFDFNEWADENEFDYEMWGDNELVDTSWGFEYIVPFDKYRDYLWNEKNKSYDKGGQLKPIPQGNKGLPKLPEEVRNRMGYMDNGGMAEEKQMSRTILNDSVHKLIKKNGTDIMKYSQFELSTLDSYVSHRDISEQLAETIWGLAIKNGFNGYMSRVLIINSGTGKILNYVNNDFSKVDAVNPSNDENIIATLLNNIQVIDIHSDSLKLLNNYDLGIIINKHNADLSNLKMVCTKLKSNNMLIFVAPMNILYGENPIKNFINEKFDLVQAFCDESTNSCISVLKKM
jgi:hypothetical protein